MTQQVELAFPPNNNEGPLVEGPESQIGNTRRFSMRIIAPTNGPFELPTPGTHKATIVELEDQGEQPNPYNPSKKRHRLLIKLKLEDGKIQYFWVNATTGYKSLLRPLVEATLGSVPPVLETPDLVGKACEVEIGHYDDRQKIRRSKVTQVRPLPASS